MLKKITKWETEDGAVFDTQEEAEDYMFEQDKIGNNTTFKERSLTQDDKVAIILKSANIVAVRHSSVTQLMFCGVEDAIIDCAKRRYYSATEELESAIYEVLSQR